MIRVTKKLKVEWTSSHSLGRSGPTPNGMILSNVVTSGPALNILIKLMSMVSLLIAPFLKGKADWQAWYIGVIPFVIFCVVTGVLVYMEILSWKDPLGMLQQQAANESNEPEKNALVKVLDEQQSGSAQDNTSAPVTKKTSGKKKNQNKNCWPI